MKPDLVLDIGNSRVKGGFFEGKTLVDFFDLPAEGITSDTLLPPLKKREVAHLLISSVNSKAEEKVCALLAAEKIPFLFPDYSHLKLVLDVDEQKEVGHDRIANSYGALSIAPVNDSIVIDIGTAITADFIAKEGRYLGGMIFPGPLLCARALADYTDKLPLVTMKKPPSPLAKTTLTHLDGGIYYGVLGAIERMIDALKSTASSPSSVKVIATGGAVRIDPTSSDADQREFLHDLEELVDLIHPHLTLVGLHEILTELTE